MLAGYYGQPSAGNLLEVVRWGGGSDGEGRHTHCSRRLGFPGSPLPYRIHPHAPPGANPCEHAGRVHQRAGLFSHRCLQAYRPLRESTSMSVLQTVSGQRHLSGPDQGVPVYLHAWYAADAARPWSGEAASPLPLASVPAQAAAFPQLSGEAPRRSGHSEEQVARGGWVGPGSRLLTSPLPARLRGLHCGVNTDGVRSSPCLQNDAAWTRSTSWVCSAPQVSLGHAPTCPCARPVRSPMVGRGP